MSANSLLKKIRKNIGCESFETSPLCKVDHYISTGVMSLNRIITGSIYRGIPSGRVTILVGKSQCTPKDQKVKILYKKVK